MGKKSERYDPAQEFFGFGEAVFSALIEDRKVYGLAPAPESY